MSPLTQEEPEASDYSLYDSSDYYSSSDYYTSEADDVLETPAPLANPTRAIHASGPMSFLQRMASSPALLAMKGPARSSSVGSQTMNKSASCENLEGLLAARIRSADTISQRTAIAAAEPTLDVSTPPVAMSSPLDVLKRLMKENGRTFMTFPYSALVDFFEQITPAHIDAYDAELAVAARNDDVSRIRMLHSQGRELQCCNRFGESIVHTACRRASLEVLRFFAEEAGVSLRVRCDYGRNPLHDACWTSSPNFEVIRLLLKECPDFLFISDKRGFTPLSYVNKASWAEWEEFLSDHQELLMPKELF